MGVFPEAIQNPSLLPATPKLQPSRPTCYHKTILSTGDSLATASIYMGMIRKLKSGQFRLYSRKKDASTGKRRNLGTFATLEKAKQHEREVQYFKKH